MHYLRIEISGATAKQLVDQIDGVVRGARLAACHRPDPDGVTFEVMGSDEDLGQLLAKLWNLESMCSADLQMTCRNVPITPGVDPGCGPRTREHGLVSCDECQGIRQRLLSLAETEAH